jgi:hypothetical protein
MLAFSGITDFGESVLRCQHAVDLSQPAIAILAELKRVQNPLPHHMSMNAMISVFSKGRDSTSTSLSNKHLGIYKSLIQHYNYTKPTKSKNKAHVPTNAEISLTAIKI